MEELESIRDQIDEVDRRFLELLGLRIRLAKRAGEIKKASGKKIYDPVREKEILDLMRERAKEAKLDPDFAEHIYREIIVKCREEQG